MGQIKRFYSLMKHCIKLLCKHGFYSLVRYIKNKKFHRSPNLNEIQKIHLISEAEVEQQKQQGFKNGVKISIVTPLYNTPEDFLNELLDSLEKQTYSNWELCLADGSDAEHQYVGEICKKYQEKDKRIVYKVLESNKGISGNTNECIGMATGEYIGLLDHDDLLHSSALFEVVKVIESEKADFIYTDEVKFEGKLEEISNPLSFNLKPGFGKYDLRSHNYICHFTVFDKKLLEDEKECFREEFDGSQDHDMVLRLTEKAKKIVHIPKVLYYWRVHSNSVSKDLSVKPYAVEAAIHAVDSQLCRMEETGSVKSSPPFQTLYKIEYSIHDNPKVSIVLHDSTMAKKIQVAINNIVNNTNYRPIEIVYSCEKDLPHVYDRQVELVNVGNDLIVNRDQKWNASISKVSGEYVILFSVYCNPMTPRWVEEMLMLAQKPDVCSVGPKICYKDGRIAYAGISLWRSAANKIKMLCNHDRIEDIGYEAMLCHVRHTTATIAACMMFSKSVWEELGGFSGICVGYEDIDFCVRGIQQKLCNVWTGYSQICYEEKHILPKSSADDVKKFESVNDSMFVREVYYHSAWEKLRLV